MYHSMGIRLYRRWLAVISMSVATGIQALSIDTIFHQQLGTPEFFNSVWILVVFTVLMFLGGYWGYMRSERHFRIMGRYRGETKKGEHRGYVVLGVYLLVTILVLVFAGEGK
jgi:uncharacterized membrane protein YidH (DUF202 family)